MLSDDGLASTLKSGDTLYMSKSDVYRRQNLASVDIRFQRLKSIPALKEKKIFLMAVGIGIQMKRNQLTEKFNNKLKKSRFHVLCKNI